jgi:signal transduction histidine kinase
MQQQLPRIESEDLVADLIHDLRQPLDTIESSAYYLRILLAERGGAVEEQLRIIGQQVELASRMLTAVASSHRAGAAESLDFTKSQTAVVT